MNDSNKKPLWWPTLVCLAGMIAMLSFCIYKAMEVHRRSKQLKSKLPLVVPTNPVTVYPSNELHAPSNAIGVLRRDDFTPAQKAELAAKFKDRFQPVAENWTNAYGKHVPFSLDKLALENFVERLGESTSFYMYTFVFGDYTFTMQESNGQPKVSYLASKESIQQLNQLNDAPPKLTMPVTRDELTTMVKADTGVAFKPNQIFMIPTGTGSALNGGATITIAPPQNNPNLGPAKLSMVFGPDGKLAYYLRDVAF